MPSRVLVTGGAGFIGSHLVARLVDLGYGVRVLDNFETGDIRNLDELRERIELIKGDVRDPAAVRKAVRGTEFIFHEAALASVPRSIKDPVSAHEVNTSGTLLLLEQAREAGVRRVIYAGSSSAYGDQEAELKSEELVPRPLSPYAVSKLAGEAYCRLYSSIYGLETVILRYFNVFGPRQSPDSQYAAVVPLFIDALARGKQPLIYGDGEQSRDFTYVDNVVDMNLAAAFKEGLSGEVINAGCGDRITVNRLAREIARLTGKELRPEYGPPRAGDVRHSQADTAKARALLGLVPAVPFEEGLRRTVDWFLKTTTGRSRSECKPLKV
ncbi:MAG: SDR family oxidoreductase [Candidatus Omnitrophica bacterium]|nr:SDR family oxidoreductase [Candidatus Omnitrophota bacterium]